MSWNKPLYRYAHLPLPQPFNPTPHPPSTKQHGSLRSLNFDDKKIEALLAAAQCFIISKKYHRKGCFKGIYQMNLPWTPYLRHPLPVSYIYWVICSFPLFAWISLSDVVYSKVGLHIANQPPLTHTYHVLLGDQELMIASLRNEKIPKEIYEKCKTIADELLSCPVLFYRLDGKNCKCRRQTSRVLL